MKLRLLLAPLIIAIGFGAFSFLKAYETDVDIRHDLALNAASVGGFVFNENNFYAVKPSNLGIQSIKDFDEVTPIVDEAGYQLMEERRIATSFEDSDGCGNFVLGSAVIQSKSNSNKYLALAYEYKLRINGCKPAIDNIVKVYTKKEI